MRRLVLAAVVLTLAACGSPRAETDPVEAPVAAAAPTVTAVFAPAVDDEAAWAQATVAMTRALYALPARPAGVEIPAFFSRELAAALSADDLSAGAQRLAGDYRYGRQAPPYEDLTIASEGSVVRAEFKAGDTSHSYIWAFCQRADGQIRVADLIFDDDSLTSVFEIEGGGSC